jgi:site-specific DNA-methyltransferase (adenine-specific)
MELIKCLIKISTDEKDLILDCFIGSGTVAVASVETNRNFIGMELSEEYCKIANERLSKLNDGNDSIPPKPKLN